MKSNTKQFQQAKQAAQRLYKKVNFDGGNLQTYQLSSLMQETYDFLKTPFKPTTNDLKQYLKVLDANGDGNVSLQDLETLAVTYLCGEGVLGQSSSKKSVGFSQSQYSSSQNNAINEYSKYESNQNTSKNVQSQNNNYSSGNYGLSGQYSSQQSYGNTAQNNQRQSFDSNNYQTSRFQASSQVNQNSTNSSNNNQNQFQSTVNQSKEHLTSKQYGQTGDDKRSKYTPTAQNYLNITRGLFKKYSNQNSNTITRDKVSALLTQTYSALGRKGYFPSEEDVNVWMKLCDTNGDGHVQEAQYQYFVVRALERSGIQVNS